MSPRIFHLGWSPGRVSQMRWVFTPLSWMRSSKLGAPLSEETAGRKEEILKKMGLDGLTVDQIKIFLETGKRPETFTGA